MLPTFSELRKPVYLQIDDQLRSYLRVSLADIEELDFTQEVSSYSKRSGYWVYLDMVSDGPRFLARQHKPDVKQVKHKWPGYVEGYKEFYYNEGRPILPPNRDNAPVPGDA
jgi:hypothetical protein